MGRAEGVVGQMVPERAKGLSASFPAILDRCDLKLNLLRSEFVAKHYCELKKPYVIIDLLIGLFRGAVFAAGCPKARKQPISVNGTFPLLNGPFADLDGPFPQMP